MEKKKRFDVLVLHPQDKPVYFVIPEWSSTEDDDLKKYIFEEGQCPSDFFNSGCELIVTDGDTDPHGIFEYVRSFDEPEFLRKTYYPGKEWPKILPEAFEKDEPYV